MAISRCKVPGVRIPKHPNRSPLYFAACARHFGSRLCQCNELIVSSRGKPQEGGLRSRFPGCHETKACAWALVVEILVLVSIGATLALLTLAIAIPALRSLTSEELPQLALQMSFSSLLLIVGALSLVVAFIITLLPLAQQFAVGTESLLEHGRSVSRSRSSAARGRRLVAAQLALATATVVIALSLSWRLRELQQVNLGFEKEHLMTARVSLTSRYSDGQTANRFVTAAVGRLRAIPGIQAAGATTQLPLSGAMLGSTFMPDRRDDPRRLDADLRGITPGFLNATGIPLLAGRDFGPGDSAEAPGVAIVDEVFAHRLAPAGAARSTDPLVPGA